MCCKRHIDAPEVLALAEDARRDGLSRRARDPELLDVRAPLRPPGPHVRVGLVVEPARAPLPRLRLVGPLHAARRPDELHRARSRIRARRRASRRTRPARRRTTRGPISRTSCTRTTSAGATTSSRGSSPTATTTRCSARRCRRTRRRRGSGTRCRTSTPCAQDRQLENVAPFNDFFSAAQHGTLPAVSWLAPAQAVSEHPPGHVVAAARRTSPSVINAVMRSQDWSSTAIFLAWDDWGGFYDHVKPPTVDGQGYGLRVPGARDQPVREARLHRPPDPQLRRVPQVHRGRLPRRPAARPEDRRPARPAAGRAREREDPRRPRATTSTSRRSRGAPLILRCTRRKLA